jgi:hypothetical protein
VAANNGAPRAGAAVPPGRERNEAAAERCPRRIVLLCDGEGSEVEAVLAEFRGGEVSGRRLHAELPRLAALHPARWLAAEWLGPLGWTRFLWCRR